jgi:mycofactocin precursor
LLPGQGVTGAGRRSLFFIVQVPRPVRQKGLDEVSADTPDQEDENVVDELLVEEVSVDGLCGVY